MSDQGTATSNTPRQIEEAAELEMKKLSEKLPGKIVTLAPRSAFFVDADNQYTLTAYKTIGDTKSENGEEKVTIQKGWKLRSTMLAIKHGILRVSDDKGKDVTADLGGPAAPASSKAMAIVDEISKPADPEGSLRDKKLMDLLSHPNEETVLATISSRAPTFEALERLLQLEKAGENPAFSPRGRVVDGLTQMLKNVSGMTQAGKLEDAEETTVTTKRV